jgi:hypothetical protein
MMVEALASRCCLVTVRVVIQPADPGQARSMCSFLCRPLVRPYLADPFEDFNGDPLLGQGGQFWAASSAWAACRRPFRQPSRVAARDGAWMASTNSAAAGQPRTAIGACAGPVTWLVAGPMSRFRRSLVAAGMPQLMHTSMVPTRRSSEFRMT